MEEDSKVHSPQTVPVSPRHTAEFFSEADEKKLRIACKKKCKADGLFKTVLNYDEDEDKTKGTEWWVFFHKQCNVTDLKKIEALDFKLGYIKDDLLDKTNYFLHLPKQ